MENLSEDWKAMQAALLKQARFQEWQYNHRKFANHRKAIKSSYVSSPIAAIFAAPALLYKDTLNAKSFYKET